MNKGSDKHRATPQWIESIRRAGVVRRYLKIERPTVADAERAAAEIEISKRSFYYLVRAFDGLQESAQAEIKASRISPQAEAAIAAAVDRLGIDSAVDRIGRLARDNARAVGAAAPANKTIAARMRAAIGGHQASPVNSADVIVDHALLEVPVESQGLRAIPTASIVIHQASGRVLGFALELGQPSPQSTAAAIRHAVEANSEFPWTSVRLTFHGPDEEGWRVLEGEIERAGIRTLFKRVPQMRYGAATGRLLANRLGKVPLRPRASSAMLLARTSSAPATSMSELCSYLAEQIRLPRPKPLHEDAVALMATTIRAAIEGR